MKTGPSGDLHRIRSVIRRYSAVAEFIELFPLLFHPAGADETILRYDETIFRFGRRCAETSRDYQVVNETAGAGPRPTTGDSQMRTFSFILAFAFVLAGPSVAGSADQGLPGVGTFAYHGSPVATAAFQPMIVAAK